MQQKRVERRENSDLSPTITMNHRPRQRALYISKRRRQQWRPGACMHAWHKHKLKRLQAACCRGSNRPFFRPGTIRSERGREWELGTRLRGGGCGSGIHWPEPKSPTTAMFRAAGPLLFRRAWRHPADKKRERGVALEAGLSCGIFFFSF